MLYKTAVLAATVMAKTSHIATVPYSVGLYLPDLFFPNPTGAGFCRIWNDKSGRSQIFKLTAILLI